MRLVSLALIAVVSACAQQPEAAPPATPAAVSAVAAPAPAAQPAPPAAARPATPPASLVRAGVTEKLTDHVWAIPDGSAPAVPNVGLVVGSKAVLVVDTGMGKRNGETVLAELKKVWGNPKQIYIVTTHFHPEHDLGAHAFPADAKMIRSEDQKKDIAENGLNLANVFSQRSALNAELLKDATFRPADISFDKEYSLDLGGVTARIMAVGPNHTRGDTVVFVDGVLFSGDDAMRPQPSVMAQGATLTHWLATLDQLDALKPTHVVPSHGPRGDASIIAGYRTYFTRIKARAAVLKRERKSQDEAVQAITDEMVGQYPDRNRLGGAIRAAYAEANG
jgi:glyoxylase-like metal-dependent hydrolase (beta-lactamase superfamily II)